MFLCINSFLNILGVGKTRYTNLQSTRFTTGMNTHKNSGNSNAAMTAGTQQSVVDFINHKVKEEGEVYSTRIIRSLDGFELREEEKGVIDLPLNTYRREMCKKYCFERGWAPKSNSKGRYPKLGEYNKRSNYEFFWQPYIGTQEVFSWWAFRKLWHEHCSHIKMWAPCNDTCGECTVFRNAFRYQEPRKILSEAEEKFHSSGNDDNRVTGRHAAPPRPEDDLEDSDSDDDDKDAPPRKAATVDAKDLLTDDCIGQYKSLKAPGYPVMQAKAIRAYVQWATSAACKCRNDEVPHDQREYTIVCEYAQNLNMPHYGDEQPGEIYYFSALTINLFGIVNLRLHPNKLNYYAYLESKGKKGSNNVASLIMQDLHDKFWLRKGFPGPRGKRLFSAGFSELTDTRLEKEDYATADHMLLIGRTC
jgi:hypothetical protein